MEMPSNGAVVSVTVKLSPTVYPVPAVLRVTDVMPSVVDLVTVNLAPVPIPPVAVYVLVYPVPDKPLSDHVNVETGPLWDDTVIKRRDIRGCLLAQRADELFMHVYNFLGLLDEYLYLINRSIEKLSGALVQLVLVQL
jgi:hypothetical protein